MFKMVGICWRVQVYIVRQQWQKLGNSPITRPRNITAVIQGAQQKRDSLTGVILCDEVTAHLLYLNSNAQTIDTCHSITELTNNSGTDHAESLHRMKKCSSR